MKRRTNARPRVTRFCDGSELIESRGGYTLVEAQPPYRVARPSRRQKRQSAKRQRASKAKPAATKRRGAKRRRARS